ncbi:hypothetical protein H8S95_16095 [Pontibacter sp. KCTC 32443]|uniref:DUF6929 family protein n=1 Tax=Pontibacter TaxID=323449 RepID=UPI00164D4B9D|nr:MULTISPECIES: hypothetical protein [Pontibacter]MBC5775599.1 hypothetical protein [Pontibacter sp. KCTC 32443]
MTDKKKRVDATEMESTKPSATITAKHFYKDIPSGSGIEATSEGFYIIGDDTPFLYQLDKNYNQVAKYELFDTADFKKGRIPKPLKPDLESLTTFKYKNKSYLFTLGSGSSEVRNKAYLVELPIVAEKAVVKVIDLKELFNTLQKNKSVVGEELLNIEGLDFSEDKVYLLQRALNKAGNLVLTFELSDFNSFLFEGKPLPAPALYFAKLPSLQGYQAGFSGAYVLDEKLFFTASVESAPDAIQDGEVLGSYVGYIPLADLPKATSQDKPVIAKAEKITDKKGGTYIGKVESLVVEKGVKPGKYKVIAISDDDKGHSEILEVEFIVE